MVQRALMGSGDPGLSNRVRRDASVDRNGESGGTLDSTSGDSRPSRDRYPGWLRIAIIAGGGLICWLALLLAWSLI